MAARVNLTLVHKLENFTSPIAVSTKEDSIPTEIRIRVEQEIHQEGGDDCV